MYTLIKGNIFSPVYFYGISAALKSVIDRLHNPIRKGFKIKKLALLLVAGMVLVRGVKEKGDIKGTHSLEEAYNLGAAL